MLGKHLLVKTAPEALNKNIVCFKDFRVTVLFDRLFRIEKNENGDFCDLATQSVWFRNMPEVPYTVSESKDFIEIKTQAVTLHLEHSVEESYVILNDKKVPISNEGNLFGTTRTLDQYNGDVHRKSFKRLKLNTGVCSKSGVAVVNDTESLRLTSDGGLLEKSSDELDIYVFAYGNEYREAVKALYAITGNTPMLPRYAFGNWWSRYHAYTDEEYIHVMDEFEKGLYSFFAKECAELKAQLKTGKKADSELLGAIREALAEYVKRV
jgi:alpha-glucosidase (family GH31 glycosyl hydrolase)